ncbi:MAG TPA: hypothetical protein VMZ90_03040 [Vicinamibacterales bacterium]|nr:hypothetical protein [Vicinamibacterales bacterium]
MAIAALLIGLVVFAQGVLGLAAPDVFASAVRTMQTPPFLHVAAFIRVLFGVILVLAASGSRAPLVLRCLGSLIVIGGLVTPIFGARIAEVILEWWAQGTGVVRWWAALSLVLGAFIIYANAARRGAA